MLQLFGALERKSDDLRYGSLDLWRDLFGGGPAKSGVSVNWQTAFQVTTFLACARRLAEAIMVPCKVYQHDPSARTRREAREHPLYRILGSAPNQWQTGLEYREMVGLHTFVAGNHYSLINRVGGRIDELIPLDPASVTPSRKGYALAYRVRLPDGSYAEFGSEDIWHVRGPSWDGSCGMDVVRLAREAIGLALATEESHALLHKNGAQPGGILSSEGRLSTEARDKIRAEFVNTHAGLSNKYRALILDGGMKWQPMGMTGVDSQHIELRNLQTEEICRALGVHPIMIGYTGDKSPTYASAEQLQIQHQVHTVRPTQDRVATSGDRWLLTEQERADGYYIAFVAAAFLGASTKDKAEYNKIALGGGGNPGWRTLNEVRADDEDGPVVGGDRIYVPFNVVPIGDDGFPRIPDSVSPEAQVPGTQQAKSEHAELIEAIREMPTPTINVTVPIDLPKAGGTITKVTKTDEHGRIQEFERHPIEA